MKALIVQYRVWPQGGELLQWKQWAAQESGDSGEHKQVRFLVFLLCNFHISSFFSREWLRRIRTVISSISVSPLQVSAAAAAVSPGHGDRKTPQILPGGRHPDLLLPDGTFRDISSRGRLREPLSWPHPSSSLQVVVLCFALFLGSFCPSGLTPCSSITETGMASKQMESYTATGQALVHQEVQKILFCSC